MSHADDKTIDELRNLLAEAGLEGELQVEGKGFWTLRADGFNQFWGSVNHQPYDNKRSAQFAALIVAEHNALPGLLDEIECLRTKVSNDVCHIKAGNERIAELEAALRELTAGGSMDEKDMLLARKALIKESAT